MPISGFWRAVIDWLRCRNLAGQVNCSGCADHPNAAWILTNCPDQQFAANNRACGRDLQLELIAPVNNDERVVSSRQHWERIREGGHHADPRSSTSKAPRQRTALQLVKAFLELLRPDRRSMAVALSTLTLATILALIPPAATKFIVDYVLGGLELPAFYRRILPSDRWTLLLSITGIVIVVSIIKSALHIWGRWYATRTVKRVQMRVRKQAFSHAVRLPLHRVYELKSGGASSLLREDAGSVGDLVFGMLYNPWRALIQLTGSVVILTVIDWRLLLGVAVLLPIVYYSHRTWIGQIRPRFRQVRHQRQFVDGFTTEIFAGIRVVRAFARQQRETIRFMVQNHVMIRLELDAWWWSRSIEIVWETLIPFSSAGLLLYGGYQVLEGHLSTGDLMMFLVYLLMLLEPLAVLAHSAAQFQNSLSGLDRVLDLLDEPRELEPRQLALQSLPPRVAGRMEFEQVGFGYPGTETLALQNVSFDVPSGSVVALVGPSGAGKTTLCHLVARLFDVTHGSIRLDGTDIRSFDVEQYRSLLGIVDQEVFLFDGTIAENIGYGRRGAEQVEVEQAARMANASEFIEELPFGYESIIGERGIKLSGGQRQRLAIARAILADPKLLILDEATSNLDTHSERLIQQSLGPLMEGRTSFVIAHRLSTIRHANLIIVLDRGRILEMGSHDQLLQTGRHYHQMLKLQLQLPDDAPLQTE